MAKLCISLHFKHGWLISCSCCGKLPVSRKVSEDLVLEVKVMTEICSWNVACFRAGHDLQQSSQLGECCPTVLTTMHRATCSRLTAGDIESWSAIVTRKTDSALLLLEAADSCEGPFTEGRADSWLKCALYWFATPALLLLCIVGYINWSAMQLCGLQRTETGNRCVSRPIKLARPLCLTTRAAWSDVC